MISVPELEFGWNDAVNYRRREEKELFNKFFIRTHELDDLIKNNIYFLIGEKGTGKTAYALYISNNGYKDKIGIHNSVGETDYGKFIKLKLARQLQISDYQDIWTVIIYLLLSKQIIEKEKNILSVTKNWKLKAIQKATDEFYKNGFTPEITYAIQFVENLNLSAKLMTKYLNSDGKIGAEKSKEITTGKTRFQMNLYDIQKEFEAALRSISLNRSYILFIDGIDVRQPNIPFDEYLECVIGLANAAWSVNNNLFSSIRDSHGRLRVVLLLRPDIFELLNLDNQNSKWRDNSVLLNWKTKNQFYRNSLIFEFADNILKVQQQDKFENPSAIGDTWDYYFPFNATSVRSVHEKPSAFIEILKYTLYRPRDIITILKILQENFKNEDRSLDDIFSINDLINSEFQDKISQYFLGEIRDELSFHYKKEEYKIFIQFFSFLKGSPRFSYETYVNAFLDFYNHVSEKYIELPDFCENADAFLQFLYNLNIICYTENTKDEEMYRWCFKERSYGNISPTVKPNVYYIMHYGMLKAFNVGKTFL